MPTLRVDHGRWPSTSVRWLAPITVDARRGWLSTPPIFWSAFAGKDRISAEIRLPPSNRGARGAVT